MSNPDEIFLQAVCATPEDDTPRLIFADFLEESGDLSRSARAEFIRLQCEGARLTEDDPRRPALVTRAEALLRKFRRAWNGPLHCRLQAGPLRGQVRSRGLLQGWNYRRGFVAEITAHAAAVVRYLDELLALGPLEHVRVRQARTVLDDVLDGVMLADIKELDLSGNELVDGDIPWLILPAVARLRFLDLRWNRFSPAGRAQLERAVRDGQLPPHTLLGPPAGTGPGRTAVR